MTFDWSVSFGQILQVVLMLLGGVVAIQRFYYALDKRVSSLEREIVVHADKVETELAGQGKTLLAQGDRMERWETTLFKLVADLSRVIGQMEAQQRVDDNDRRRPRLGN